MSVNINADTTNGLVLTSDTSGEIKLQSAGADIATVTSSGITMASGKTLPASALTGTVPSSSVDALSTASGSAPSYSARAWVTYNAQTNTILANGNVSSVTDHATGQFTVNFDTAMPDVNYAACGIVGQNDGTTGNHLLCEYSTSRTTSSARVVSGTTGGTETDEPYWTYIAFR